MASTEDVNQRNETGSRLIRDQLKKLLVNAYASFSNFRVAAAVIDENGDVHYGVNVENQSFPVSTCAEAGAISALRVAGGKNIKKLYLLSDPNIGAVPCGACRQRLAELGDPQTQITTFGDEDNESSFSLAELFPHSFRFK